MLRASTSFQAAVQNKTDIIKTIALTYKNRQLKGENKLSKQIDLNVQDYIKKFI